MYLTAPEIHSFYTCFYIQCAFKKCILKNINFSLKPLLAKDFLHTLNKTKVKIHIKTVE